MCIELCWVCTHTHAHSVTRTLTHTANWCWVNGWMNEWMNDCVCVMCLCVYKSTLPWIGPFWRFNVIYFLAFAIFHALFFEYFIFISIHSSDSQTFNYFLCARSWCSQFWSRISYIWSKFERFSIPHIPKLSLMHFNFPSFHHTIGIFTLYRAKRRRVISRKHRSTLKL